MWKIVTYRENTSKKLIKQLITCEFVFHMTKFTNWKYDSCYKYHFLEASSISYVPCSCNHFQKIERFTVCAIGWDQFEFSDGAEELFSCKSLNINIVSKYQAGIWTSCTQPHQVISNPSEFGQKLLLHGVENWSGLAPEVFLSVPAKEITVDIIVPKLMCCSPMCSC